MTYDKQKLLDAIGPETPFKIVMALIEHGPTAVEGVAKYLGMKHSAISHQLGNLRAAGVLSSEKVGNHVIYQIAKSDTGKATRKHMAV